MFDMWSLKLGTVPENMHGRRLFQWLHYIHFFPNCAGNSSIRVEICPLSPSLSVPLVASSLVLRYLPATNCHRSREGYLYHVSASQA